jgi:anti-sigma regulatory factor (Ser/Thr protein kinase)
MTNIRFETATLAGVVIATPVGRLELGTYAELRDGLLKYASDEPCALIVRLGPGFEVPGHAMLAVFKTVWTRISRWTGIPVVLLAKTEAHLATLRSSGVSRFVCTTTDLKQALEAAELPPHHGFLRVPLPNSPTAAMTARTVMRDTCRDWDLAEVVDDAVLVVSELVENAVRHARSEPVLRIEQRPRGLSLAVRDTSPELPRLNTADPEVPGHRGVQLVDQLSAEWGCLPSSDGGKIVWAVLGSAQGD